MQKILTAKHKLQEEMQSSENYDFDLLKYILIYVVMHPLYNAENECIEIIGLLGNTGNPVEDPRLWEIDQR